MQRQETNWIKSGVLWKAFLGAGRDPALKPVYLRSAALLSLLLAFGLRLYRLGYQSIWWDEGYSINISAKSLMGIVDITAVDIHPPFYYWLLHFWMPVVGKSEFSVRFLSLIFGVLTVVLVYRLGLRLLGRNGAFLIAFLASTSPFLITYSQVQPGDAAGAGLRLFSGGALVASVVFPGRSAFPLKPALVWLRAGYSSCAVY
jgi:predicted membrane-bound mannosyltransferase